MRVVIDTNVWISFLIGKSLSRVFQLLFNDEVEIISSDEQIIEIISVFVKPKFKERLTEIDLQRILSILNTNTSRIVIKNKLRVCRDPEDDFILEMALESSSEYIITGDKDLLVLNPFRNIQIVNFRDFKTILMSRGFLNNE